MPRASVSYVADTHLFLWYVSASVQKLGPEARMAFDAADSGRAVVIVPSVALAEAVYIAEKGRVRVKLEHLFELLGTAINYRVYPLDFTIVKTASELKKLSEIHDRIIVATARHLDLDLISNDGEIHDSGYVRTIW
jgi:PIN domain nuclease of toxin-antitoxin system